MFILFIKAFFVGLMVAAPYGPVGMLAMQKVFGDKFKVAVFLGAGCVLADFLMLACVLALGSSVEGIVKSKEEFLLPLAGAILLAYGAHSLLFEKDKKTEEIRGENSKREGVRALAFSFSFSLSHVGNWLSLLFLCGVLGVMGGGIVKSLVVLLAYFVGAVGVWAFMLFMVDSLIKRGAKKVSVIARKIEGYVNYLMIVVGVALLVYGLVKLVGSLIA